MASRSPPSLIPRVNVVAVLTSLMLAGCNAEADVPSATRPQAVETITVKLEPSGRTWSYVGTIKPRYQSDLSFRIGGKIIERSVEVGNWTKTGDVIARVDPKDFELALAAQAAELAAAKVSRDESQASLERFRLLFRDGHVAQAALDQRQSAAAEASSRVERAERNVELARNQLAYSTLVADSDGVVTSLPVEVGQVVAAGQLIARVARKDAIEVEVALPEQDLAAVREAVAEADLWGNDASRFVTTLREVAPDADPISRTFRARFALTNVGEAAPDFGRTATLHLRARSGGSVAALPLSAIANENGTPVAWVVADDGQHAVPRPVTVQAYEQDRVLVSAGLNSGDRVVALGVHMLDPDKPIRPIETRALVSQK